ncbi:prolipoprotein diacylglyceryl transferase [Mycobacterium deserti]|uniref:Phosphatidylglycerol--prolipoprotein diacylglyceryl transferase n=1 Tax=Mycobacterium deserti TaxID=2978347 RepID=A0ABT2MCA0_9MYCO|nr:prolipoprotein diacylglyceryl transferase [Mycobacterium deserti]MCT7659898.1 prolipoprotein diacylglyceryl transferase [Mycobacterium deserti]
MTTTVLAYIPSPAQGVWHLGPFPLRAYALFIIVGIVAALIIGDRRWEARGGERGVIYDIALWAVPFGLIGGRLYHVITDWRTYFSEDGAGLVGALKIWDGGLGIWGAVALGGVGAWIACRRRGIPLPAFGDAIAPGIVLAQAIGRLGNYFNQELYGRATTLPWGLEIYQRQDATGAVSPHLVNGVSTGQLDSVVHPTFLYELLWNLLVFAVLIYVDRRFRIGHGRLFALYVAGYCLGRFWIELMRSDAATVIAGIRINSFTATFVFIGAVVYIMVAPKGREDPATLQGTPRGEQRSVVGEELAAVAATSAVVGAARVAGESDGEDAKAASAQVSSADDPDKPEAAIEAEALANDVAEAPDEDIAEAQEFAAAKEEAEQADVADEAEELGADVAGVPADDVAEAEAFAIEGEEPEEEVEAEKPEAVVEAEQLAADVEAAPSEEIEEAAEFAVAGEESDDDEESAEPVAVEGVSEADDVVAEVSGEPDAEDVAESGSDDVGGVGAVEGEDAAQAEESAEDVHAVAVEGVSEADDVVAEVSGEPDAEDVAESGSDDVGGVGAVAGEDAAQAEESAAEAHAVAVEGVSEADDVVAEVSGEPDAEDVAESGSDDVGGVGAVAGEDAAQAENSAAEAHAVAVEGSEKADDVAAEVAAEPEAETPDASESVVAHGDSAADVGGVGAVEGDDASDAQAAASEAHETAVKGVEEAEGTAAAVNPKQSELPQGDGSGGRIRRWLRQRRDR